ncbi:UNVERIFIED_CONTAM: hypothetical protein GTU68_029468 [Idotea baltica]|nr:hypothetical protein [Idotea baltica]
MKRLLLISFLIVFITGCASSIPAPVESRGPTGTAKPSSTTEDANRDWRPDIYTVKKGDTLYSIGLAHGLDYREIAAANNIYEPFTIAIGQKLSLNSLKVKEADANGNTATYENEDGVIISPIDTDTTATSSVTPVLTDPKAIREPYSKEALNRKPTVKVPTAVTTTLPSTPIPDSPAAEPTVVKKSNWAWPTQGKIVGTFNAAKNKGIDIAGKKGQTITASAAGKVIYAGSDLRGYGKLVIIKHSTTYLSVYAHNSKINVKEGQAVKAGQKIAAMGDTDTNTVKLHFEIRERGKSVDPAKFLPQN